MVGGWVGWVLGSDSGSGIPLQVEVADFPEQVAVRMPVMVDFPEQVAVRTPVMVEYTIGCQEQKVDFQKVMFD